MKKIIVLLMSLLLVSSFVLSESQNTDMENRRIVNDKMDNIEQMNRQNNLRKELNRSSNVSVKGLELALSKVKNPNATQAIQNNLVKFEEKYSERLEKLENIEIAKVDENTGEMEIKAKEEVKFFGFIKGKATKRFEIDKEGKINEKAPWYSLFYSET